MTAPSRRQIGRSSAAKGRNGPERVASATPAAGGQRQPAQRGRARRPDASCAPPLPAFAGDCAPLASPVPTLPDQGGPSSRVAAPAPSQSASPRPAGDDQGNSNEPGQNLGAGRDSAGARGEWAGLRPDALAGLGPAPAVSADPFAWMAKYRHDHPGRTRVGGGIALGADRGPAQPDPGLARSAAPILESEGDKSRGEKEGGEDRVRAILCRCGKRICACGCAKQIGERNQAALEAQSPQFPEPRLFTVTVDPKQHPEPLGAYRHVMRGEHLRRAIQAGGANVYAWVMECQRNGHPHWHCIIDVSECPAGWYHKGRKEFRPMVNGPKKPRANGWVFIPHFFDLNRVNAYLQEHGIGGCRLSERDKVMQNGLHAIRYICKYLTGKPKHPPPQWVQDTARLRWVGGSQSLGPLSGKGSKARQKRREHAQERQRRADRAPIEAAKECCLAVMLLRQDPVTGKWRRFTAVKAPYRVLEWGRIGHHNGVTYHLQTVEEPDATGRLVPRRYFDSMRDAVAFVGYCTANPSILELYDRCWRDAQRDFASGEAWVRFEEQNDSNAWEMA